MATSVTWLYAIRLEHAPERRHMIRGRGSFAFSDVRHIIAKAALRGDFDRLCASQVKPPKNLPVAVLLRMVARMNQLKNGETSDNRYTHHKGSVSINTQLTTPLLEIICLLI